MISKESRIYKEYEHSNENYSMTYRNLNKKYDKKEMLEMEADLKNSLMVKRIDDPFEK